MLNNSIECVNIVIIWSPIKKRKADYIRLNIVDRIIAVIATYFAFKTFYAPIY